MKITHIRNATLIVEYGGKTFLIDPMLAEKGTYPPFPNSIRQDQNNPLVNLPISVEEIIADVDAVIVTHLHLDHFDDAAKQALPKDIKMFVQNEEEINTHKPEIIVVNGGDNQFLEGGSLVMGKEDIYQVFKAAPHATIISVHMEAVNHWTLSREELKGFINEKDMASRVFIPDDGEVYTFK
ncbi:MBL fold metallo-hydrolase [Bacillus sp. T_4]|nr:MBL fold metallo-hydrolase [Bacillus sp. T_4]UYO23649.1 MBL fold metallo-hydrolase [Bacillus sp. T_4]